LDDGNNDGDSDDENENDGADEAAADLNVVSPKRAKMRQAR